MLRQQMEAAAQDRQEAREREERLTKRLLTLATPAVQDRQVRSIEQGETESGTSAGGGDDDREGSESGTPAGGGDNDNDRDTGARTNAGCLPSAALASAPRLVSGASLREFAIWKEKYKGHCKLTRMNQLSSDEQKAALIALLDDDLVRLVKYSLGININDNAVKTDDIVKQIGDHLRKQRNVILDRREFFQRVQQTGEPFNDFLMAIKEIHEFCNFCEHCQDDQLRDKIVTGIRDTAVLEELLADESLTLQKAINICRARENAQYGRDELQGHFMSANSVSAAHRRRNPQPARNCSF